MYSRTESISLLIEDIGGKKKRAAGPTLSAK
jgi:hypothetical protein